MGLNITRIARNKFYLDIRTYREGRQIRKRLTFHGTKAKAEEKFIEVKKQIQNGITFETTLKAQTFSDLLSLYEEKRNGVPKKEQSRFNTLMRDLGNISLDGFAEKFKNYIQILKKTPSSKTGKYYSNGTINRYMAMVKASFNIAVDFDLIDKNPIKKSCFPKLKEVPRDRILSNDEQDRLMNVIGREAPHLKPVVRFALQVPCRKSELINMCRSDLDLFNNCIRINNGTTKNNEGLYKPIPPNMQEYFRNVPEESEFLFYRIVKGEYFPIGDFKNSWSKVKRLAGIENFVFHDTRHQSATQLIDNGTPEYAVMTIAGWKTNMLKTYYHRDGKKSLELIQFKKNETDSADLNKEAQRNQLKVV